MESLAHAALRWAIAPMNSLRHVVGVDVMHRLQAEVGQRQLLAPGQQAEHLAG